MAQQHLVTVATVVTWQDVLAQPDLESMSETFADGHDAHQYIDESLYGMNPLDLLILDEEIYHDESHC